MTDRHCLLIATFNMDARAWSGVPWEFAQVLGQIESLDVVAPRDRFYDKDNPTAIAPLRDRLEARWLRARGRHVPRMPVVQLTRDYDLALYVCQFIYEIEEIVQVRDFHSRAKKSALFLFEGWPATFAARSRTLALLDRFDHVFVLNGSSIAELSRYTSTPISQLSTATDLMRTSAAPDHPRRVVDFCCIGRNDPEVHEALLKFATERGLFYSYDVWKNQNVARGWEAVRRWNADLIRRSRFYIAWDPARQGGRPDVGKTQALSTRYFEGAAGGAILLGSAPDCPEYHAAFDWPDALVPLDQSPAQVIGALEADPERMARIRHDNLRQSLLRHDWAHRWASILATFDLRRTARHVARENALADRASTLRTEEL